MLQGYIDESPFKYRSCFVQYAGVTQTQLLVGPGSQSLRLNPGIAGIHFLVGKLWRQVGKIDFAARRHNRNPATKVF